MAPGARRSQRQGNTAASEQPEPSQHVASQGATSVPGESYATQEELAKVHGDLAKVNHKLDLLLKTLGRGGRSQSRPKASRGEEASSSATPSVALPAHANPPGDSACPVADTPVSVGIPTLPDTPKQAPAQPALPQPPLVAGYYPPTQGPILRPAPQAPRASLQPGAVLPENFANMPPWVFPFGMAPHHLPVPQIPPRGIEMASENAFSQEVNLAEPPTRFKAPNLSFYHGRSDPHDHVAHFESATSIHPMSDGFKCRLFYTTFKETTLRWFSELPTGSVNNFAQFKTLFLAHHASVRRRLKSSPVLFDLDQGENETLKAYLARFHQETMEVRELHPQVAMNALIRGLKQGPFKYELSRRKLRTLEELLQFADEHIDAEDCNTKNSGQRLRASRAEQPHGDFDNRKRTREGKPPSYRERPPARPDRSRDRPGAEASRQDRDARPPPRRDGGVRIRDGNRPRTYDADFPRPHQNFTPLRVSMAELVAAIKGKEYFRKPEPMRAPANLRDQNKYCAYHRDHGHDTEHCRHLRNLIEELIEAGKLTEFMINPNRRPGKEPALAPSSGPVPAGEIRVAGVVPAILGGDTPRAATPRHKRYRESEVHSASTRGTGKALVSPVTFSDYDLPFGGNPNHEAVVVAALISNFRVGSILIDTGSSVNIIFKSVFEKLRLTNARLEPTNGPLYGFSGERRETEGALQLPVTWGGSRQYSVMADFVVVDAPASYNCIFGRPLLNAFRAVVSTYHVAVKFTADGEEITIRGDLEQSRNCHRRAVSTTEAPPRVPARHIQNLRAADRRSGLESAGGTFEVSMDKDHPDRTVRVSSAFCVQRREELEELLREHADVFAWTADDMPGIDIDVTCHRLNVQKGFRPIKQKMRKNATALADPIRAEVEKLLKAGFIRETQYPDWVSNVVMVKKASGQWRMCVDFTNLNAGCPKDPYPLPSIDAMVDASAGYPVMSFMDAFSGYHQIRMHPADEEKTSFITADGVYCYRMMPFGLKNAGATYQRLVDKVFAEQRRRNVEVYVDDILVKSQTPEQHLADLRETFSTMRKYKMKLNPQKCAFGAGSGKFLGYLLTPEGIKANPDKVEAILSMKSPTSSKEVQKLAGRLAALSRFISKSGEKCAPFFKTLRGAGKFNWTEECEVAFARLKEFLTAPPLLQSPRPNEQLLLYLGVGEEAVSSVLIREEAGRQWPVYYTSRILHGAEERYPLMEKLALALIVTARRLRPYFQAHPVSVITDHPLRNVLAKPEHSGRLLKWSIELGEFEITYQARTAVKAQALADFIVDFNPDRTAELRDPKETWSLFTDGSSGTNSQGAGVVLRSPGGLELSQAIKIDFPVTNNQAEYEALLAGLRFALQLGVKSLSIHSDSQLLVKQIRGEYEIRDIALRRYADLVLSELAKLEHYDLNQIPREENALADSYSRPAGSKAPDQILHRPSIEDEVLNLEERPGGWMEPFYEFFKEGSKDSAIKNKAAHYFLVSGTLYRRSATGINLRCVREDDQGIILAEIHSGECGSHSGPKTLANRILRQGYFWPTLRKDAEEVAKKCKQCQLYAPMQLQPSHRLQPINSPWPFAIWGMDLVGPLPVASGQRKFILVMIDYFTKWIEAKALAKVTAQVVQNFVWTDIICRYGVPICIITDNGTQFSDKKFQDFCRSQGVKLKYASVHHPQTNGQVEAANKKIINLLKKKVDGAKGRWVELLPSVLWALRTTSTTATGQTPFSLSHGVEAVLPVEGDIPSERILTAQEYSEEELDKWAANNGSSLAVAVDLLEEQRNEAALRQEEMKRRMAKYYNRRVREKDFQSGDLVLRKVDSAARQASTGKLAPTWEGPYIIHQKLATGAYSLKTYTGREIPRTWSSNDLKRFFP